MNDDDKQFVEFCEFPTTYLGNPAKEELDHLCRIIGELEAEKTVLGAEIRFWKKKDEVSQAQNQRMREALKVESVGAYIRNIKWSEPQGMERTLVAGNIRGFAAHLRAALEEK